MSDNSDYDNLDVPAPAGFNIAAIEEAVGRKREDENSEGFMYRMRDGGESQLFDLSACKDCGGIGRVRTPGKPTTMCDCRMRPFVESKLAEAGISRAYYGKNLHEHWNVIQNIQGGDLTPRDQLRKKFAGVLVGHWIKVLPFLLAGEELKYNHDGAVSKIRSLMLVGGRNSGKTLLVSVIVRAALEQGYTARIFDWAEIYAICEDFDKRAEQDELVEEFRTLDVAVIDGLTGDYSLKRDHVRLGVDRLLNSRINKGKLMVVSAYEDFDKLDETKGLRGLRETCFPVTLPTPS